MQAEADDSEINHGKVLEGGKGWPNRDLAYFVTNREVTATLVEADAGALVSV